MSVAGWPERVGAVQKLCGSGAASWWLPHSHALSQSCADKSAAPRARVSGADLRSRVSLLTHVEKTRCHVSLSRV